MNLFTAFVGLVIGLVLGFLVTWFWANSVAKSKKSAKQNTETELKALLAQKAQSHLQSSRETIQSIENDLGRLRESVLEYEKSLGDSNQDYSQTTFFGEHASMFLRNAESKSGQNKKNELPDNQPKDFANSGSGVFVGSSSVKVEDKSNK